MCEVIALLRMTHSHKTKRQPRPDSAEELCVFVYAQDYSSQRLMQVGQENSVRACACACVF